MQSATNFPYHNACMIDKRHRAYVFLKMDGVKFLRFAAWLRQKDAAIVQSGAILEKLKLVWDSSLARMDSGVAVGDFDAREKES